MIKELTSLRGIFILLMFLWHCMGLYPGGGMAVAFFFVLSGFSLTLGYKDRLFQSRFSYKQYFTRRCIKFYPLHWICLIAAVILQRSLTLKEIPVFLSNAALLQSWVPDRSYYFSFNAVSWYLSDTIFFAAIFPIICKWIVRASGKGKVLIAFVLALIYLIIALLTPAELRHALLYINPLLRLTDFVLGIYLALGYMALRNREKSYSIGKYRIVSILIILFSLVLLIAEPFMLKSEDRFLGPFYWPLIAILLTTTTLTSVKNPSGVVGGGNVLNIKILHIIGEHSFTFFMIHQLVLRYISLFFHYFHWNQSFVYVMLSLLLTIVISIFTDRYILKPITQKLSTIIR